VNCRRAMSNLRPWVPAFLYCMVILGCPPKSSHRSFGCSVIEAQQSTANIAIKPATFSGVLFDVYSSEFCDDGVGDGFKLS
jgi:hypothetical protein